MHDATSIGAKQPLPMCRSAWRQQLVLLGALAALVLGFALDLRASRHPRSAPLAAQLRANSSQVGQDAPAGGAQPARAVGGATGTAFTQAARIIRPATLAVRATYASDPFGKPLDRIGSAVIVDANGYAVTCRHVVSDASRISVRRFHEPARWSDAAVVAAEEDLALLKVTDAGPFVPATFADSSLVRVGDWVLAAGHPFDLGLTVSAGIVSRRNATLSVPGGRTYAGLLQTDAAINEGSSGGPLVDTRGNVIGINAAIYAPSGAFSGASFAIESNRVRDFVARVLSPQAPGTASAAWGLGLAEMTPELAARLACPVRGGVLVSSVLASSPAELARIAEGDVITAIGGARVSDLISAQAARHGVPRGAAVVVELWRGGARHEVTLNPGGA